MMNPGKFNGRMGDEGRYTALNLEKQVSIRAGKR